jgi:hypothetical protein
MDLPNHEIAFNIHKPSQDRLNLQQYAAMEKAAIKPPWKTLRVYHFPIARRRLAVI